MRFIRLGSCAALAALLGTALAAGCGGDEGADFEAPTCDDGQVVITGTVDGDAVDAQATAGSYIFVNALGGDPGSLVITAGGIQQDEPKLLSMSWDVLVANGKATDASGAVDFSASGGVHVGNCDSQDGRPGFLRMDADGDGGEFLLRDLYQGADCSQPAVDGEVRGCFRQAAATP